MGFPCRWREGITEEGVDDDNDNDSDGKYNLRPESGSSSSFPHNGWWRILAECVEVSWEFEKFPWGKDDKEKWRKPPAVHGTLRRVRSTTRPRRSASSAEEPGKNTWQSLAWRGKTLQETLARVGHSKSWQSVNRIKQLFVILNVATRVRIYTYKSLKWFIYNLTNDCTNTIFTNNMLLHVSTFKMSLSGSSLRLTKITYRYIGLDKIRFWKYKMINFNKMLILQRDKRFALWLYTQALLMLWLCLLGVDTGQDLVAPIVSPQYATNNFIWNSSAI